MNKGNFLEGLMRDPLESNHVQVVPEGMFLVPPKSSVQPEVPGQSVTPQQEDIHSETITTEDFKSPPSTSSVMLPRHSSDGLIRPEATGVTDLAFSVQSLAGAAEEVSDLSSGISGVLSTQRAEISVVMTQITQEEDEVNEQQTVVEASVDDAQAEVTVANTIFTAEDSIFTGTKEDRRRIVSDFMGLLSDIDSQGHEYSQRSATVAMFKKMRSILDSLDNGSYVLPDGRTISLEEVLDAAAEASEKTTIAADDLREKQQVLAEQLEEQQALSEKAAELAKRNKRIKRHLMRQKVGLLVTQKVMGMLGVGNVPESLLEVDDGVSTTSINNKSTTIKGQLAS